MHVKTMLTDTTGTTTACWLITRCKTIQGIQITRITDKPTQACKCSDTRLSFHADNNEIKHGFTKYARECITIRLMY